MKSPQMEFNENFTENIESIKEAISSNNEDEESITNEKKPTNAKLTQMLSDFLNEMSTQVKKWKNFSLSNITAFEILKDIVHHLSKYHLFLKENGYISFHINEFCFRLY